MKTHYVVYPPYSPDMVEVSVVVPPTQTLAEIEGIIALYRGSAVDTIKRARQVEPAGYIAGVVPVPTFENDLYFVEGQVKIDRRAKAVRATFYGAHRDWKGRVMRNFGTEPQIAMIRPLSSERGEYVESVKLAYEIARQNLEVEVGVENIASGWFFSWRGKGVEEATATPRTFWTYPRGRNWSEAEYQVWLLQHEQWLAYSE